MPLPLNPAKLYIELAEAAGASSSEDSGVRGGGEEKLLGPLVT